MMTNLNHGTKRVSLLACLFGNDIQRRDDARSGGHPRLTPVTGRKVCRDRSAGRDFSPSRTSGGSLHAASCLVRRP